MYRITVAYIVYLLTALFNSMHSNVTVPLYRAPGSIILAHSPCVPGKCEYLLSLQHHRFIQQHNRIQQKKQTEKHEEIYELLAPQDRE